VTALHIVPHDDAIEDLMGLALAAATTAWKREDEEGNGSLDAGESRATEAASGVLQHAIRNEDVRQAVARGLATLAHRRQENARPGW
jgi:hypothetical protein